MFNDAQMNGDVLMLTYEHRWREWHGFIMIMREEGKVLVTVLSVCL